MCFNFGVSFDKHKPLMLSILRFTGNDKDNLSPGIHFFVTVKKFPTICESAPRDVTYPRIYLHVCKSKIDLICAHGQ
jgi:hypothetical protein